MRVLADLASYGPHKPLVFNRAVVEAVARWLQASDAHKHLPSPLDVLDPILAKEGHSHVARGATIALSSFTVNLSATQALRGRAIGLMVECTPLSSPRVTIRALGSLRDVLRPPPMGLFGRRVSEEEKQQWIPEQLRVLEIIGELARSTTDPVVQIKIVEDLWYVARDREPVIADRAREIIESIPDSLELRITRAMWGHSLTWWDDPEGYEECFKKEQEETARELVLNEWLESGDGPSPESYRSLSDAFFCMLLLLIPCPRKLGATQLHTFGELSRFSAFFFGCFS